MNRSNTLYKYIFKNYHLSKFQKKDFFISKDMNKCQIFITGGNQNEAFMKDLISYTFLLFGQKPKFNFKKQSRQNALNQLIYFKTTITAHSVLTALEKISQVILPNQENYLLNPLPNLKASGSNCSIVFKSCLTNEEIQYFPKSRPGHTVNHFNLSLNFPIVKASRFNILFFFRFYYFPLY